VSGNGLRWIKGRTFTEKFCVEKHARIFYGVGEVYGGYSILFFGCGSSFLLRFLVFLALPGLSYNHFLQNHLQFSNNLNRDGMYLC